MTTKFEPYKKYVSAHFRDINKHINLSYKKRFYVWKSYLEKFIPKDKNMQILEVGCGMGHNLYSLSKLGFRNILGIDLSPECIDFCKAKGFNVLLLAKNDNFYLQNSHKFDLVILYDVLEHYSPEDGADLLLKIRQVLKDDGRLIISVPNADYPLNLKLAYSDITHKFIYNEISLSQLLKNCDFISSKFIQMNSYTIYDKNLFKQIFKKYFLRLISFFGELFWKIMGMSQGIFLKECKPTLICISKKK